MRTPLPLAVLLSVSLGVAGAIHAQITTNPIPIKAAMKMLGRDPGDLRLPMTTLEDVGMTKLKK